MLHLKIYFLNSLKKNKKTILNITHKLDNKGKRNMEAFLTATILSGVVYDIVKTSSKLTLDNFKTKVKGWLIDDTTAQKVVDEINQIDNIDELNETGIARRIEQNQDLMSLLKAIKIDQSLTQVTQIHSGSGDNVAGDKHVTYKSDK